MSMTEFEWRLRYAAFGFRFFQYQIPFEQLAEPMGRVILEHVIEDMQLALKKECHDFIECQAFTRISIYPKKVGESVNHLDPLVPRLGIMIEMRYPSEMCRHCRKQPAVFICEGPMIWMSGAERRGLYRPEKHLCHECGRLPLEVLWPITNANDSRLPLPERV